jgi:ubiquinone/menaquinone biosynthesis C-methylase UbiE
VQARKDREQQFHDIAFSQNTREKTGKFYSITKSSRDFYCDFLSRNCYNKKVLEYGCGPGSFSFHLTEKGARVTGIDISPMAIRQAMERAQQRKLDGIEFLVMDAEQMDFEDSVFDVVCGTSILHHLILARAFSELSRVLKPGGKAIFIEPLGHNPVINLYRKITPNMRTPDEHPLLIKDLQLAEHYFKHDETRYFHLVSLVAVLFRNLPFFPVVLRILDGVDSFLFTCFPPARRFAWTVVLIFTNAKK